jgi:ABC-2 type transport system ATP-binding protein
LANAAVEAQGLCKTFGAFRAVQDVSLSIPQASIFGMLGPNGAGKTTTLRMLMGIIEPDAGQRTVLGEHNPRAAMQRVGYLPEERGLYPGMSARDTIAFIGALRGLPWAEGRHRADQRLGQLDMAHAAKMKIRKMSKGMAQMVQLVGALIHDPELIVLDEPFSGLDPVNQERLEAMILAQRDRGSTIILSTHVMGHAQRLCDGLTIIAGGQQRFLGTVDQARATLPLIVRYRASDAADANAIAALLPPDARLSDGEWQFTLPDNGIEPLLAGLVGGAHGVEALSIQRPDLHEAFVSIVGQSVDERYGAAGTPPPPAHQDQEQAA